jgi:hypothetical protein
MLDCDNISDSAQPMVSETKYILLYSYDQRREKSGIHDRAIKFQ